VCLEKFTCLESTARLAHAAKYAMTYPLENRPHGSLQERWSISPGWRSRSSRRLDDAPDAPPSCSLLQDKLRRLFSTASRRKYSVLCHRGKSITDVSSTSMP